MKHYWFNPYKIIWTLLCLSLPFCFAAKVASDDNLTQAIERAMSREKAPLISREQWLRRSQINNVQLSFDGKYLAYTVKQNKVQTLWVYDITKQQHQRYFSSRLVSRIAWSTDSQSIFLATPQGVSAVYLVEPDAPRFIMNLKENEGQFFLGLDYQRGGHFLISNAEGAEQHSLYRVNLDGEKEKLHQSDTRFTDVVLGASGQLLAFVHDIPGANEVIAVDKGKERLLFTCTLIVEDSDCRLPIPFSLNNKIYIEDYFDSDLRSLYEVDMVGTSRKKIHSDPLEVADTAWTGFDPNTGLPNYIMYFGDYTRQYFVSTQYKVTAEKILQQVHSENLTVIPRGKTWLVIDASPSRAYSRYFLYDLENERITEPLASVEQQLQAEIPLVKDEHVAVKVPLHYMVGDGMDQQGYLTLPLGVDLSKVPLIVLPHGGPKARTVGDYFYRAQFLANRGYAVFEPNFRSSIGFGRDYIVSSNHDFGNGRVQQDIIDGMHYVLSRGIGEKNRLAIVGYSFGGFSALNGVTFTPDLFQVGVAMAAPSDINVVMNQFAYKEAFEDQYLNARKFFINPDLPNGAEILHRKSPLANYDHITRPVYLWAGVRDEKVPIESVRDYAIRLREAGKNVMLIEDEKSSHSTSHKIGAEAKFYLMEKALADSLGGRIDTKVSPELKAFLQRSVKIDQNNFIGISSS